MNFKDVVSNRTTVASTWLLYKDDSKNRAGGVPHTLVLLKKQPEILINTSCFKSKMLVRNKINHEAHPHSEEVGN